VQEILVQCNAEGVEGSAADSAVSCQRGKFKLCIYLQPALQRQNIWHTVADKLIFPGAHDRAYQKFLKLNYGHDHF
jgi:hypothetical protein